MDKDFYFIMFIFLGIIFFASYQANIITPSLYGEDIKLLFRWIVGIEIILVFFLIKRRSVACRRLNDLIDLKKMKHLNFWYNISPRSFEIYLGKFYSLQGYEVEITPPSRDGGVDIILNKYGITTYVQCKKYTGNVGVKPVRELYGVMCSNNVNNGIVANSKGGFSKDAYLFAQKNNIKLLSANDICNNSWDFFKGLQ